MELLGTVTGCILQEFSPHVCLSQPQNLDKFTWQLRLDSGDMSIKPSSSDMPLSISKRSLQQNVEMLRAFRENKLNDAKILAISIHGLISCATFHLFHHTL